MCLASSDAKKTAAAATSNGSPCSPRSGTLALLLPISRSRASSVSCCNPAMISGVSENPIRMQFTRMLSRPYPAAHDRVSASTAALPAV